jgi:hypothetical protein
MEEHFDFVNQWPEWRRENAKEFEHIAALGAKLSGNAENLKRQLLLPVPEIPNGLGMEELLVLERHARFALAGAAKDKWLPKMPAIVVGSDESSFYEAMYEVVRRAIAALGDN